MGTANATERPEVALVELRANIGDVINRVAYGNERVMITRNGKPAAVLISVEELACFEELEKAADGAALEAARGADDGYRINIEDYAAQQGFEI